ncbi:PaaI family thioesterase [Bacillus piscicola]|uniref:PaaI family thioesterase n=1 Tax=Bacillus piscicola TaxID=1632684 RepID=UPI001F097A05|nr:PaaI family thioesterase [Bacillus piscicola]
MDKQHAKKNFDHAIEHAQPEFEQFFLAKFFDLSYEYGDDTCTVTLESKDYMFNPQGTLHGGVICFILDVSMGHLCKKFLGTAITLEMKVQFHRPINEGKIVCQSAFVKKGRKIIALKSDLYNEKGKLAATGTSTWYNTDK